MLWADVDKCDAPNCDEASSVTISDPDEGLLHSCKLHRADFNTPLVSRTFQNRGNMMDWYESGSTFGLDREEVSELRYRQRHDDDYGYTP
jgi:hypothetical protein